MHNKQAASPVATQNAKRINIIGRSNGVGLDQDVTLIQTCLEAAGHTVHFSHCRSIPPWSSLLPRIAPYDANIFLERVFPRWFRHATYNLLIPNQERFPQRHTKHLKHIHTILCKSAHATEVFSPYANTLHIGFTSKDRHLVTQKKTNSFIHLAGKSTLKGTEYILQLWKKHPEWPTLTLIQHAQNAPGTVPANVHLITDYLTTEEITQLLNTHSIHLCPSLSEGWGHYIVEAMSCEALVITTDAPPMHELITTKRGMLIPYASHEPRHLGTNFHVSMPDFENAIIRAIQLSNKEKTQLGTSAKDWFHTNHTNFTQRLQEAIANIIQ